MAESVANNDVHDKTPFEVLKEKIAEARFSDKMGELSGLCEMSHCFVGLDTLDTRGLRHRIRRSLLESSSSLEGSEHVGSTDM